MSKRLKFVFVAVHLKQGVPYYAETWVLVLISLGHEARNRERLEKIRIETKMH